jgi:membrane-associated phospholipid phosphatase
MRGVLAVPNALTILAKFLSFVINPNFCQFFIFIYFRERRDVALYLVAFFFLAILPLIGYVIYVKYVLKRKNLYVLERRRRFIPFMVNILSIFLFHYALYGLGYAERNTFQIMLFLWFLNLVSLGITFLWRISIHQIAASASIALIMILDTRLAVSVINLALVMLVLAVGWSRYHLKGHTIPQIIAGTIFGFFSIFCFQYLRQLILS